MNPEITRELNSMLHAAALSGPSSVEFELAYHARVVMDRIRFAIRITDQSRPEADELREVGIQLMDALDRLEKIDRRFRTRLKPGENNHIAETKTLGSKP
jgi:hypothetical protein